MSCDGTYGFVYCGSTGLGVGVFTVQSGAVIGCDSGQVTYRGTATDHPDGSITLSLIMRIPQGTPLVTGTSPQEVVHQRQVEHRFPPGFGHGEPEKIFTAPAGPLTVMVKRIPDEFASAAAQGISLASADRPLNLTEGSKAEKRS